MGETCNSSILFKFHGKVKKYFFKKMLLYLFYISLIISMSPMNFSKILKDIQPDLERIEDSSLKEATSILLNIVEVSVSENSILKVEAQLLKNEINRLKGEQGTHVGCQNF